MSKTIWVYVKPACIQSNATFQGLRKQGLSYEVIDITEVDGALDYVMALGYLQAPVVLVEDADETQPPHERQLIDGMNHWSGFRPDRIKAIGTGAA